jgi:ATP-dependent helicase/nuclease subunit B
MSDSEIEERIMKSLKMNGLLLDDPDIIREMDNEIEKSSNIIPATIKKDGTLSNLNHLCYFRAISDVKKIC